MSLKNVDKLRSDPRRLFCAIHSTLLKCTILVLHSLSSDGTHAADDQKIKWWEHTVEVVCSTCDPSLPCIALGDFNSELALLGFWCGEDFHGTKASHGAVPRRIAALISELQVIFPASLEKFQDDRSGWTTYTVPDPDKPQGRIDVVGLSFSLQVNIAKAWISDRVDLAVV